MSFLLFIQIPLYCRYNTAFRNCQVQVLVSQFSHKNPTATSPMPFGHSALFIFKCKREDNLPLSVHLDFWPVEIKTVVERTFLFGAFGYHRLEIIIHQSDVNSSCGRKVATPG